MIDDESESLNNKDEAIPNEINLLLESPKESLVGPPDKPDSEKDDRMNPLMRLIYIGICSIILYLFIEIGLFNISIGEMTAKDLLATVPGQMIIGIVCGLTESKIGISIFEKAKLNFGNDEKEVMVKTIS